MVEFGHFPAILFKVFRVTLGLWVYVPAPMIWCLWFVAWCPLPSVMSLALSLTAWLCALFSLCFILCLPQSVVCFHVFYPLGGRATSCFGSPSSHVCVQFGFLCLVIPNLSLLCSHVPPLSLISQFLFVPRRDISSPPSMFQVPCSVFLVFTFAQFS